MRRIRRRSRWACAAVGVVVAAALATGCGSGDSSAATTSGGSATVDPHVAAGAHNFVAFACAQCHGDQGKGGVSSHVPALTDIAKGLTPAALREIIDKGVGVSAKTTDVYMPVWGGIISDRQVNDLIAYLKAGLPAVPDAVPVTVPTGQGDVVAGQALYQRYGCVNCHGPNGLGGVPNPAAPDKTIPSLASADFKAEFNTDAKILQIVRDGSVLGKQPIVSMPRWGEIIPPAELNQIVAYIKTLGT